MEMNYTIDKAVNEKAKKNLLYWSMASMVIFFGGFCSYYLVMEGNGSWLAFKLPPLFFFSTAIIVLSSASMLWAQNAIKKNNQSATTLGVLVTLLLGIGFCICQFSAWSDLYHHGIVFSGRQSNISGSILYVITFLHFMHIVAGLIALTTTLIKTLRGKYSYQNYLGITLCGAFWHFLDALWVILFLLLYFNR